MTDAKTERPEPWAESAPDGYKFVAVPDPDWKLVEGGDWPGGRCRQGNGMGHGACRKPAVAALNRGFGKRTIWWAYCPEHLYSRWIEDGEVLNWVLREIEALPVSVLGADTPEAK